MSPRHESAISGTALLWSARADRGAEALHKLNVCVMTTLQTLLSNGMVHLQRSAGECIYGMTAICGSPEQRLHACLTEQ